MSTDTIKQQEPTDNSALLKQLLEEQRRTNALLEEARQARLDAVREEQRKHIAKLKGVDPSMVAIACDDDPNIQVVAVKRDPRRAGPI